MAANEIVIGNPQINAWVWLGTLAVIALLYLVRLYRHGPYSFWESCLYVPCYLFGRLQWRVTFENDPPPEIRGGAVLAANHRSSLDPAFVQLAAGRRVHWMVAKEYCEHPIFGPILRILQVIPTSRRGMDTGATKTAIRLASEGKLVGMFPEGRLNHTNAPLSTIRAGAAMVAIKAGVPLIPLWIEGSPYRREVWSPFFMPARVRITFGTPLWPSTAVEKNQDAISCRKDRLVESAGEGVGTGIDAPATPVGKIAEQGSVPDSEPCRVDQAAASGDGIEQTFDDPDEMILEWGRRVVALGGHPDFPVQVARRRHGRHRR